MEATSGRCPAVHGESETQCEGDDDGHTNHYFTYHVEWECCPLCRGGLEYVRDPSRPFGGQSEIRHEQWCPNLPMTPESAAALVECRCPRALADRGEPVFPHVECVHHAAIYELPGEAGERLVEAACRFLSTRLAPDDLVRVVALTGCFWDGDCADGCPHCDGDQDHVVAASALVREYPDKGAVADARSRCAMTAATDRALLARWTEDGLPQRLAQLVEPWGCPF